MVNAPATDPDIHTHTQRVRERARESEGERGRECARERERERGEEEEEEGGGDEKKSFAVNRFASENASASNPAVTVRGWNFDIPAESIGLGFNCGL